MGSVVDTETMQSTDRNLLGHLPMMISASSLSTTCFLPLIFWPLTTVPIFVAKSSIVTLDRLDRWCAWPSSTSSSVIVRCFREMVLWDMASWPAVLIRTDQNGGILRGDIRSAAVLPKRYVLPGRSQSRRPANSGVSREARKVPRMEIITLKGFRVLKEPHDASGGHIRRKATFCRVMT